MQQGRHSANVPLEEALHRFWQALQEAGALDYAPEECLPLAQAQGRVTARPIWAVRSAPHYNAAIVDGLAVRAADIVVPSETAPVRWSVGAGAAWVGAGDPLPAGMDAVVTTDHLRRLGDGGVAIVAPVVPWQHVRRLGEDIAATELVLPECHRLGPVDLGACAAAGLTEVPVRRRPRVAVIPTGNQLVPLGAADVKPGQVVDSNSLVLSGLVRDWGGLAEALPPVADDLPTLRNAVVETLAGHDLVIIEVGYHAGADYVSAAMEGLGTLLVRGIAVQPDLPVALAVAQGKPVVGLPGYPVSAVLSAELVVKPWLERKLGLAAETRPRVKATIIRNVASPVGEDEFLRVKLGRVGSRMMAIPLQRGAGVTMALVRADGLVHIPRMSGGLEGGAPVSVELLRSLTEVEHTIVAIGSHDPALDLMATHLRRRVPGLRLASSNVGSLGGLLALLRGRAHLAGCHLLDQATGQYNIPDVRRGLPGMHVVVVNLVERVQGLMAPPGNPRGISSLADLARPDVVFVNRRRGSGTRLLLDYHLKAQGLKGNEIKGYGREELTHLAVAAAVQSGSADTGLGVLSAARALGLDFVPLLNERYDLVIPRAHYESDLLQPLLALLSDPEYRQAVAGQGGCDTSSMGAIMAELG